MHVDLDDLIDSNEVAEILGLGSNRAVSIYRGRYDDFPGPVVIKGSGKCMLWLRADVVAWNESRGS